MIFGWITSCSGSSALLVGPASACRPSSGYRQSLIVTRKGSFGPNLDRLTTIKKRYDPNNLFRLNHNIIVNR